MEQPTTPIRHSHMEASPPEAPVRMWRLEQLKHLDDPLALRETQIQSISKALMTEVSEHNESRVLEHRFMEQAFLYERALASEKAVVRYLNCRLEHLQYRVQQEVSKREEAERQLLSLTVDPDETDLALCQEELRRIRYQDGLKSPSAFALDDEDLVKSEEYHEITRPSKKRKL